MSTVSARSARGDSPQTPRSGLVLPRPMPLPEAPAVAAAPAPAAAPQGGRETTLGRYQRSAVRVDALAAAASAAVAYAVGVGSEVAWPYVVMSVCLPVAWVLLVALVRGYERRFLGTGAEEYRRITDAGLLLIAGVAVGALAMRADLSRAYVFTGIGMCVLVAFGTRYVRRSRLYRRRRRGEGLQRVLVVGRADAVAGVITTFNLEPQHGLLPVGACLPRMEISLSHLHGVPVVGDPSGIVEAVQATKAEMVAVVSHPDLSGNALRRLSWALEERGVDLVVSPGIIEVAGPRLSIRPVAGLSLLHLERPSVAGGRLLVKSALDRMVAAGLLLVLAPVLVGIGLAVRLGGGRGPVFFRQTRIGVNGREFTMVKFRSMVEDAENQVEALRGLDEGNGVLFKVRRDPRITSVGAVLRRTSLDELPQLFNVVRGEMSLVGPRPPLPEEVAGYNSDAVRRLRVRPGLTGLWQVSGRSDLSWEESLRLDLRYVDNWSLALDLSILWRTLRAVVRGSGAY